MTTQIWISIGPDNCLLPDGARPFPEPMLNSHLWSFVPFPWKTISKRLVKLIFCIMRLKMIPLKLLPHLPWANELTGSWFRLSLNNPMPICVFVHQMLSNGCECCSNTDNEGLAGRDPEGILALTHLLLDKIATISKTTFVNSFPKMKICVFWFQFHWRLFLWVQLTIRQHWFRWWLGAEHARHYRNQCWPSSLTHYAALGELELRSWNCSKQP